MEDCKCKPAKSYAERIIEYREFVDLVKRMREAQKEWVSQPSFKWGDTDLFNILRKLEKEVDEYLKKMEV